MLLTWIAVCAASEVATTESVPRSDTRLRRQRPLRSGGDDAIAVKSGIDWVGRTFGRATRDVRVSNLLVESGNGACGRENNSRG